MRVNHTDVRSNADDTGRWRTQFPRMAWATIEKSHEANGVTPNLERYATVDPGIFWEEARSSLDGLPGGRGLNIAHEAVDRHATGARRSQVALRCLGRDDAVRDLTYGELAELTGRFANVLRSLAIEPGELVCALAGRLPELYVAALGTLKCRCAFSPLFAAFGPEPIRTRLELGGARVLVTTETLYRRKVEALRPSLPRLEHVLLIREDGPTDVNGTHDLETLLAAASPRFEIPPTDPDDVALIHFTSGTTGRPKGAVHVHEAVVAHHVTGRLALDLHPEDIFWCTADPGGSPEPPTGSSRRSRTASRASSTHSTSTPTAGTASSSANG